MTGASRYPLVIRSRRDLRVFLELDLRAHGLTRWRWHYRFFKPELRYQRVLRRVEYLSSLGVWARPLRLAARLQLARESVRTGISVPPGTFGPGLSIAHHGSVVVNHRVRAGAFCRIHSATNLGSYKGAAPELGDFVYIGPGAVVFGGVRIGDRAVVGANAVVRADVPADSTAVGSPARIIPERSSARVMPKRIAQMIDSQSQDTDTVR